MVLDHLNRNYPLLIVHFTISVKNQYTFEVYGTFVYINFVWWTLGAIYSYFDITNKPNFIRKYKIQDGTNEPVDARKFRKLIMNVFVNQTIVLFPILHLGK